MSFRVADLPDCYRIVKWGYGEWGDCKEGRLKVYLDKRGIVREVGFG